MFNEKEVSTVSTISNIYKQRVVDFNSPVWVYRNLTKGCYSLTQRGLVIGHACRVILENVHFKIREGGRQKVLQQRRKNVHAFAVGNFMNTDKKVEDICNIELSYNPYIAPYFFRKDTKHRVDTCNYLMLNERGLFAEL